MSAALIGTWELISRTDRNASGEIRPEPTLGADPIALLYYDASGHFAAQFMKRDRTGAIPIQAATGPNNSRAVGGYDAYFGTYSVDEERRTVTQTLLGALSPENVGQVITREMTIDGDTLTIELNTASSDGEPVTRTLTWKRVG